MNYKTVYKIVTGYKDEFEDELNKLGEQGYTWSGNMNTNLTEKGILYSLLMMKIEQV